MVPYSGVLNRNEWKDGECRIFLPSGINPIAFWGDENGNFAVEYSVFQY